MSVRKEIPIEISSLKMYGNHYISPHGKVYNRYGLELKQQTTRQGYKCISLLIDGDQKTVRVHRLVGLCYIPNPDNLPEINHKDGNKANNDISNLEWVTRQQNIIHSSEVLGVRKENPKLSIPVICLNTGEIFSCTRTAHEKYPQCTQAHITACCKRFRRRRTTGGLSWAYWKPNELVKLLFDCGYKKYPESYEGEEYYCYLCLAQRWLREVHKVHILIDCIAAKRWEITLQYFNGNDIKIEDNEFTYEQALEAGIKKCLTLILEKGK